MTCYASVKFLPIMWCMSAFDELIGFWFFWRSRARCFDYSSIRLGHWIILSNSEGTRFNLSLLQNLANGQQLKFTKQNLKRNFIRRTVNRETPIHARISFHANFSLHTLSIFCVKDWSVIGRTMIYFKRYLKWWMFWRCCIFISQQCWLRK